MPVENERKFVLYPTIEEELVNVPAHQRITQGYLKAATEGVVVRLRKAKHYENNEKTDLKRIFTFKSRNPDFTSTEIETEISKKDFDSIWPKTTRQLTKTRYKLPSGNLWWEIDVFLGFNGSYFWMAEIELPEKQDWPDIVPEYIKNHLLFKVPLTDSRFSSKKLCDESYAKNLFKQLIKEQQK